MKAFKTKQERFWVGGFGDEYTYRNQGADWVASNTAFFASVLSRAGKIGSVVEYGANLGLNLQAIRHLLPDASLAAVEINGKAVEELRKIDRLKVVHGSILDFEPEEPFDFVLIKGVLIHIDPEMLPKVYDLLHKSSRRYICIAEYYNPSPVEISYRGHSGKLFKRDFAGEVLDRFNDVRLVDYGFTYRRDPKFPQDDITWFLLEKI